MAWKTWERNVCLTKKEEENCSSYRGRGTEGKGSRTGSQVWQEAWWVHLCKNPCLATCQSSSLWNGEEECGGDHGAKMGDTAVGHLPGGIIFVSFLAVTRR